MVKHWSGQFKGLDSGAEDYEISAETWELIWQETADAIHHIPADFVRVLGKNPSYFTAEAWCFWIVYLAPVLLRGRFRHQKYYDHACQFSEIVKHCIAFEITYTQIDHLEENIIDWVQKYEEYYYQYDEARLSACPLTIHGWLHVADDICFCGPSWATWTFWMERYCGHLQSGLRSKRFPWANLNNRVLHTVYLEQLGARYDLEDELSTYRARNKSTLSRSEKIYEDYPQYILRAPYKNANIPDPITKQRTAAYFAAVLRKTRKTIQPRLPEVMPRWGKVRVVDGDSVRSASACATESTDYEIQVQDEDDAWIPRVFYGRLEEILVCKLPEDPFWAYMSDTTCLLAVITPCLTLGTDTTKEVALYTLMSAPIVTDLATIVAVIGRVQSRGDWLIIDRSGGLLHPEFVAGEE
ncbi:hypothetical protein B0H17DRAFT_950463 [Mycena rosella]|uniref:Uncharacterized protein n=1 Tax=Mycena rosella TaxID=1033263 RepID=A0AAD7G900_MYCRO|nr:hypothetical protein B0H17DRAFT_950463 [Mycena rosella]